jgi:hypothetical protein
MGKIQSCHEVGKAFKGISKGTSNTNSTNGCAGSFNKQSPITSSGTDETISSSTVKSSTAISQHKKMAMGGSD